MHAQYAGNVLVYGGISPNEGDWFGGVTADDAEQLLTALTEIEVGPLPTMACWESHSRPAVHGSV